MGNSKPYTVLLKSRGNPDYGENPRETQSSPAAMRVASLDAASRHCRAYIEENNLGGGNWSGGQVLLDGKPFAYVSYNGRVWRPSVPSNSRCRSFHGDNIILCEPK